jgi:peptidoglycan hydrolase-like amidase
MPFSLKKLTAQIVLIVLGFALLTPVLAEPNCDDTSQKLSAGDAEYCANKISAEIAALAPAHEKNKKDLANLNNQISVLKKKIDSILSQLKGIEADIAKREENLAFTEKVFGEKVKNHYTFLKLYDPITPFLFSASASDAFREISFRQRAADEDRKAIIQYAEDIKKLRDDKNSLENTKKSLDLSKTSLDTKAKSLGIEVAKVETYLASLSAKQQAFLAQKLESLGLSRSAYNMKGGCSSDINPFKSPGFSPSFAFFTYGVPNRVGLNQFGAKGRAEAGQNYETILKAYYNADVTSGYNTGIAIRVLGTNEFGQSFNDTWNIEDYVKHIYEMPTSWSMEALKAQAIAARSYALAYTNNGSGTICPSQKCQVVKKELNDGNWQSAVDATRGVVLTTGGQPVKAWYSSTHGGYAYTSADIGWSGTSWTKRLVDSSGGMGSFSDLFNNAYDKSSSIFYCDWGSRSQYNKTAWLKPEEIADIANVILLAKADGSTQKHLSQTDKPNPDGVDTWDEGKVRSELSSRGITPFSSVSDVSIGADFGSGRVTTVTIDGRSFDGQDFKTYFNLRAPANIQIVGPLYNVEKR